MSLLEYAEDKKQDIIIRSYRRKLFYKIYFLLNKLNQWTMSVYKQNQSVDRQSLLIFAYSILKSTKQIQSIANELISLLEEENVSQKEKSNQ